MELHSLGGYRLVQPVPTKNTVCRHYLARRDEAPEGPPGYLVKMLMPGDGAQQALYEAQFEHEAQLLAAFNHPGIPTLHAHGAQDGVRFMVMDYIDGVDLATLLGHAAQDPRALSKEIAVYLLGQLADAVRHVHTFDTEEDGEFVPLDCLHRDICPANIVLSKDGDVVLIDFGSASSKWLSPEMTAGQAGTKAYMAPERVIGGGEATVHTELFSLAVVLWEILKGQRCLWAEDELKTMEAIARFDISHSSRRVSGLSSKLSEIVRRNLDRDPGRRYISAKQVLQRLAQSPEAASAEKSRLELAGLVSEAAAAARSA